MVPTLYITAVFAAYPELVILRLTLSLDFRKRVLIFLQRVGTLVGFTAPEETCLFL